MKKFYGLYDTELLRNVLGSMTDRVIEIVEGMQTGTQPLKVKELELTLYKPHAMIFICVFDGARKPFIYHITCRYISFKNIIKIEVAEDKKVHKYIKEHNIYVPWLYKMMNKLKCTNFISEVYNRRTKDKVIEHITHSRCTQFDDGLKWLVINTIEPEHVTPNMSALFAPNWICKED